MGVLDHFRRKRMRPDRFVSELVAAACETADGFLACVPDGHEVTSDEMDAVYQMTLQISHGLVHEKFSAMEHAEDFTAPIERRISAGLRTHLSKKLPLDRLETSGSA